MLAFSTCSCHFPPCCWKPPASWRGEWVPCDLSETLNIISLPIWALCRTPSVCVCACCGRALHAYPQPTPTYDPAPSCFPAHFSVSFCISSSSVLCILTTQPTKCWTCGHPGSSFVTNSVLSGWFLHEAGAWEKYR